MKGIGVVGTVSLAFVIAGTLGLGFRALGQKVEPRNFLDGAAKSAWTNPSQSRQVQGAGRINRLPMERRQQLIQAQVLQLELYRQHIRQLRSAQMPQRTQLQQQGRTAQYRYQENYLERFRRQQLSVENDRTHDFSSDAYFQTAPTLRYSRAGRTHETNTYGADVLRQAVNYGYAEGVHTAQADRQDHWRSDYEFAESYQDASYGYSGYYVALDDYRNSFREGFRRGYEDGYSAQFRSGRLAGGAYRVLETTLQEILGLRPIS